MEFESFMEKIGAYQRFLILDTPDPSWTNFLSIDDIIIISQKQRDLYLDCAAMIFRLLLNERFKPTIKENVMEQYYNLNTKIRDNYRKIKEKAFQMHAKKIMAEFIGIGNEDDPNIYDEAGNAIVYPEDMNRNAQIGLTHRVKRVKNQFFRIRADIRSTIWKYIVDNIEIELGEKVSIPEPNEEGGASSFTALFHKILAMPSLNERIVFVELIVENVENRLKSRRNEN